MDQQLEAVDDEPVDEQQMKLQQLVWALILPSQASAAPDVA
jgi:hypothetical protein